MGKFIDIKVRGLKETNRALRGLGPKGTKALESALFTIAETEILANAKDQVPVDQSPLKTSGNVALPVTTPQGTFVEIFFGGPAAPYALIQHENLVFRHTPGQKAKYLEDPFNAALVGLDSKVALHIRKVAPSLR